MTITSNAEFAKRILLLARPAEQFRPMAVYDPDGDCIEFLTKPDPFWAERVDDLVTVYYSQETGEITGSLIKGVARFCSEFLKRNPRLVGDRLARPSRAAPGLGKGSVLYMAPDFDEPLDEFTW